MIQRRVKWKEGAAVENGSVQVEQSLRSCRQAEAGSVHSQQVGSMGLCWSCQGPTGTRVHNCSELGLRGFSPATSPDPPQLGVWL